MKRNAIHIPEAVLQFNSAFLGGATITRAVSTSYDEHLQWKEAQILHFPFLLV
jgi:hypothetical protein